MRNCTAARTRAAVALMAGVLLVTGCASAGGSEMTQEQIYAQGVVGDTSDAGAPKDGGTLQVVEYAEARSLDPTKTIPNGAVGGNALAAVYDTLLRYDTVADAYDPLLAESLDTDDNITWTLKLREGVQFSDGTPVNADAVINSIKYFMDNKGFTVQLLSANFKGMTAVDERTVEFTLNKPWATFPMVLTHGAGMIVAPAAIKNGQAGFQPIGAGPFKFESYKPDEELVLVRNDDYFGDKPHLDKIRFSWVQSDQAKYDLFKTGAVDVISVRQPAVLEGARKDGLTGIMNPTGDGAGIFINNREGHPGSNLKVRQAINAAIDPELYLTRTAEGAGLPTRNLYSQAYRYYQDIDTVAYDASLAKDLVAQAKAEGADTELTFVAMADPTSQAAALAVKTMLEEVGFVVEIEQMPSVTAQTERIYVTHDFDLVLGGVSVAEDPYTSFMTILYSTSPSNPIGYANPDMDKLIDQLQAQRPTEAVDILAQINELWQETSASVVISEGGFFSPWQKNVHGIIPTSQNIMLYHDAWKS